MPRIEASTKAGGPDLDTGEKPKTSPPTPPLPSAYGEPPLVVSVARSRPGPESTHPPPPLPVLSPVPVDYAQTSPYPTRSPCHFGLYDRRCLVPHFPWPLRRGRPLPSARTIHEYRRRRIRHPRYPHALVRSTMTGELRPSDLHSRFSYWDWEQVKCCAQPISCPRAQRHQGPSRVPGRD